MVESSDNRYWGGWATTGLAVTVLVVWLISQIVGMVLYVVGLKIADPGVNIMAVLEGAESDGTLVSISVIFGSFFGTVFTVVVAWLKPNIDPLSYLGINRVSAWTVLTCLGITAAYIAVADTTTFLLGRDIVPEFMVDVYQSVSSKPLLWISLCLFAPVFEELFFRGFLIPGWSHTRIGVQGAILLSSAVWVAIHLQYGPYELSQIAVVGTILGLMRVKTDSVLPPMICHIFSNIVATTEAEIFVNHWG